MLVNRLWPQPALGIFSQIAFCNTDYSQGFELDGFMFTGNKLEDSCVMRVQQGPAVADSAASPLDLWVDWLFYSEAYNASACGIQLLGLGAKDVARFGYIDMSLDVRIPYRATRQQTGVASSCPLLGLSVPDVRLTSLCCGAGIRQRGGHRPG